MPIVRKRRTREHIIADLSVNFVERQALLCGYTIERVRGDYGYDLLLFTYDANGERETGEVYRTGQSNGCLASAQRRLGRLLETFPLRPGELALQFYPSDFGHL